MLQNRPIREEARMVWGAIAKQRSDSVKVQEPAREWLFAPGIEPASVECKLPGAKQIFRIKNRVDDVRILVEASANRRRNGLSGFAT